MAIRIDRFRNTEIQSLLEVFTSQGGLVPVYSNKYLICPAFCDVHVHLREPGFSYKGTIRNESRSASHGGYSAICAMPNLNPVPDSLEHLKIETDLIRLDSAIKVLPYGAITVGEKGEQLADLEGLANLVCAFSDDGHGVQDSSMMREAMTRAKKLGKIISAHCEDNSLLHGGCIHNGIYAKAHGLIGISSESEYKQIERDLKLAEETGVSYHVCHISTKESVDLIRQAKKSGVNVTCETAPHYLVLDENDLTDDGRFKMNPPLRSRKDREALLDGISDGTIDMIATDHAPHSAEEKSKGLRGSPFGIVGLETAFPILYTELVKKGILTIEKLVDLLCHNPRKRFHIPLLPEDYTMFEIETPYRINPQKFLSKGKSTPFENRTVYGTCLATVTGGKTVWQENLTEN